jgi:hypothetical protein
VKSWIMPSALAGVVVLTVVGSVFVPAAPIPVTQAGESTTRISVVCPAFTSATASIRVAAVGADQPVRTSKLSTPQKTTDSDGLAVITDPGEPVRVSVQRSELFGATTVLSAAAGPARGLAAASCLSPQAESWFTGVDVSASAQTDLVLVNLDSTEAVVDLTAYGADGRLAAPRGLSVDGSSSSTVSLGVIADQDAPITVKVSTSQGRVAAFVRQLTWNQRNPISADWVPASTGADTDLVLPGVPAGKGKRTLVVTNPGERTAGVDISVLTSTGTSMLSGAQRIEVPPGMTRTIDLAAGLAGAAAGVRLLSNQPVTAGLLIDDGLGSTTVDAAVAGAAPAVPSDGIWPLALGKTTSAVLQLVNPSDQEAAVTVITTADGAKAPKTSQVKIPAGASTQVTLPKAAVTTIRIQTDSTQVRGSVIGTATLSRVKGVMVLDLVADSTRTKHADVVFDPHLG